VQKNDASPQSDAASSETFTAPFRRSGDAFFQDTATGLLISRVTEAESVVIYVGAGATMDKGGPSWRSLVAGLAGRKELIDRHIVTAEELNLLGEFLDPLPAATVIAQYYKKLAGKDKDAARRARDKLIKGISTELYPDAIWDSGSLISSIVRMAILKAINNQHVIIVTTNFDTFIEDEFKEQAKLAEVPEEFPVLKICIAEQVNWARARKPEPVGTILLVYLHGRLESDGTSRGHIAFVEEDYSLLRPAVTKCLSKIFRNANILIVGASLSDPPLVTALCDSGRALDGTQRSIIRAALLPMPSIIGNQRDVSSEESAISIRKHLVTRMSAFDVTLYCPDFYFQTAQFFEELVVALTHSDAKRPYHKDKSEIKYGSRLRAWWEDWKATRIDAPYFRRAVDRYLTYMLGDLIDQVQASLGPGALNPKDELLKIEVWTRWDPSHDNRALALWASTVTSMRSEATLRMADLSLSSEYSAVQCFTSGRPLVGSSDNHDDSASSRDTPHADRWKVFLSVPIQVDGGAGTIPVGIVTVASNRNKQESFIGMADAALMETLVDILTLIGRRIMSPRRLRIP
jgi:hypothetical protein